jgi:hypothetical protein
MGKPRPSADNPPRGWGDRCRWHQPFRVMLSDKTAQELRHAVLGYPEATIRAAVAAGLRECPFQRLPKGPGYGELVTFWLADPDAPEWFLPPLQAHQIAAIHRHLRASAN